MFAKYEIAFLLIVVNYCLCYHVKALEIITHLA